MKGCKQLVRASAILLSLLMLAPTFAACKTTHNEGNNESGSSDVSVETDVQYSYDEDGYVIDRLPDDLAFNGQNLNMLHWKTSDEYVTEPGTDAISSALYYRIINVQDRFNCFVSIKYEPGDWDTRSDFITKVYNDVNSGAPSNDIVSQYSFAAPIGTMYGLYQNLNTVEHIDFAMPWWISDIKESIEINGKIYFATGDIAPNTTKNVFCLFFNSDLLESKEYGYTTEELYAEAIGGTWTFEKLANLVKNTYEDGGNGVRDLEEDTYGLTIIDSPTYDSMFYSARMRIMDKNPDGSYSLSRDWAGLKTATLVEDCIELFHSDDCSGKGADSVKSFKEGRTLIMVSYMGHAFNLSKDAKFKYGVLPMPKYDENQSEYGSCIMAPHSLYSVTFNSQRQDMAGAVLEALAYDGYRNITPALFEEGLKVKYSEDANDALVFDIIRESIIFDVGRIWGDQIQVDWRMAFATFRDAVDKKSNWMSVVAIVQGGYVEDINNILNTINSLDH